MAVAGWRSIDRAGLRAAGRGPAALRAPAGAIDLPSTLALASSFVCIAAFALRCFVNA